MEELAMNSKMAEKTMPSEMIANVMKNNQDMDNLTGLNKLLLEYSNMPLLLRQEFRGEELITIGNQQMIIQTTKPIFVKCDHEGKPIRVPSDILKNHDGTPKMDYVANEDAIDTIIQALKFSGINKVTPITSLEENEILLDLRTISKKIAKTMALKQLEWGLDKETMGLTFENIMTIIKDARMIAKNGQLLRTIRQSVQRIEQHIEGTKNLPKQEKLYN